MQKLAEICCSTIFYSSVHFSNSLKEEWNIINELLSAKSVRPKAGNFHLEKKHLERVFFHLNHEIFPISLRHNIHNEYEKRIYGKFNRSNPRKH